MPDAALARLGHWRLERVIAQAALGWRSRWRLKQIINKARSKRLQYTFEGLLAKTQTVPPETLSLILAGLVDQGLAERVIRIESPSTGGGLRDYHSLEEIPQTVTDAYGKEIPVTPDMLKVVYKFDYR